MLNNLAFEFIIFLLFIPYMGWTSRMSGGGAPKLPLGLDQWLFALPYLALLGPLTGWWAVLAYLGAVAGKRGPNAPWLDLGHSAAWRKTSLTFLIDWLRGKVSEKTYDTVGLVISGVSVTLLPAILAAVWGQFDVAATLIASGALKAVAYHIGWGFPYVWHDLGSELDEETEIGELLTGLFAGFGVFASMVFLHAG